MFEGAGVGGLVVGDVEGGAMGGGVDGEGKDKARAMRRVVARSKLGNLAAIWLWPW